MVNLISPKQRAVLRRAYIAHLTSALGFTLAAAGLGVAVLMLPSYLLIHAEVDQAAEYVAAAQAIASERAKGQSPEILQRFQESVSLLAAAGRPPATAAILEQMTQDLPKGLAISAVSIAYSEKGDAKITISGRARTRAELIAFSNQLKRTPQLSNVTLPVADLVADVDSEFTITAERKLP